MEFDSSLGNVFKYCPKCEAAALRTVAAKLLRCEACGFELYMNPVAAVGGVITDGQGRVVVLIRAEDPGKDKWDLPGGFVDPGETAEEALRREVREEVGLEVTALRYLGSWPNVYDYMGVRYRTVDFGFVCQAAGVEGARAKESEVTEILLLRPPDVDIERFASASVGRIAEAGIRVLRSEGGRAAGGGQSGPD